jgi:hypothetical protein
MFNYNFLGETITIATQGFWLLAIVLIISVVYYMHINAMTLLSQSGKEERVAKYESKMKNNRKAERRKAIANQQRFNYVAECKKTFCKEKQ